MKNTKSKTLCTLMIASVLLGFAVMLPTYAVQDTGNVYVDPASNIFSTSTKGVGDTFGVNVTVNNWQIGDNGTTYGNNSLAGLSFLLSWNKTLLNATAVSEVLFHTLTPSYDWSNIWNLRLAINNTGGYVDYAQLWQDTNQAVTNGYAPANITSPITAVMITFKILKVPTMSEGLFSCNLTLSAVKPGDVAGNPLPYNATNGFYQINWAPPSTIPYYSVSPATYTASSVGEIFNISVLVNNLAQGWEAVGFEFKLSYNATILNATAVTEGPWLPPFGALPNQGTLPLKAFGSGYVTFGDVVLPDGGGTWHAPFANTASGPGVLAIITFNATMQGIFPITLSCPLGLYSTKFGNWLGQPLNQTAPVNGLYSIIPKVLGRRIDVYVGQDGVPYPAPFGGQGPNVPADMFWPQKNVSIWANVTYNEWPEQQKDVAFAIIDNLGNTWGIIYARTNENGTATTSFRLPWPCVNPEQYIGVWKIVATVDIACIIVNDTVEFHYDYLVQITKVTTDKTDYKHLETIFVTVNYSSHRQQPLNVTIAVTGLDETGVPFNFNYLMVPLPGTVFCTPGNGTQTIPISIPKFARAGTAEIDVAFLDNWPWYGGTVQSGFHYLGPTPPPVGWYPYGFVKVNILAE